MEQLLNEEKENNLSLNRNNTSSEVQLQTDD